jgi:hypothetical protein
LSAVVPLARIAVGVVVERRRATSPWIEQVWQPVAVLEGVPEAAPWTAIAVEADRATFYAGSAEIELHRTETANYRDNLASGAPALWVVLRPTGAEPPFAVVAVTADPAEGEAFSASGADLVELVPMPEPVREFVAAFVAEHHIERPFHKRQRDRADPEALGRRRRIAEEEG